MKKLENIEKLTNLKHLNMYILTYNSNGENYKYYFASRRNIEELECKKIHKTDAVRIVPYFRKNGKLYIVLIKEFRHPLNAYIYGTPAGIVDKGEYAKNSAIREVREEIGATVKNIKKVQNASYSSAGLTDETLECFYAEVEMGQNQNLDEIEDIKVKYIELEKLIEFIDNNIFDLQSALLLKTFYYQVKYEEKEM